MADKQREHRANTNIHDATEGKDIPAADEVIE